MSQDTFRNIRNWEFVLGSACVVLVAIFGVLLTVQGWRSRTPTYDLVPHLYNVKNFMENGSIPIYGDTGSYGSYSPPGTAWLMLPSTLLFGDLRLSEYGGSGLLHLATLLGIFLLANRYFGFSSACLAVFIYGLSSTAIYFAGSLWPIGRPDFFLWTVYFASQWVLRKQAKYLAIALAIWGVGMNVDMAILPAAFILPALWFVYRPPVRLQPLIIAMGLILLVWSPYLRLEVGRRFVDLRSQLFLQEILPADYRKTWCDPNLQLQELGSTSAVTPINSTELQPYKAPALMEAAFAFTEKFREKLFYNFQDATSIPSLSIVFGLMVLSSFVLLSVTGHTSELHLALDSRFSWKDGTVRLALLMIVCGLLTNEFVLENFLGIKEEVSLSSLKSLGSMDKLLVLGGCCIFTFKSITAFVDGLLKKSKIAIQDQEHVDQVKVLILSLIIPWFILFVVAESNKSERFWLLWPLQTIFLAAFITRLLPRFRVPQLFIWIASIGIIALVSWNSYLFDGISDWRQNGWAGKDAPEIQVINYLSSELNVEGRKQASIGYHLFIYQFMAAFHITNPQYKVGMDFDLLLQYPHRITNSNQCAEGLSPLDEYRIVQTKPRDEVWAPRMYFDAPLDPDFRLVRQFGPYQVYKRQ
jgi:hypothetical protein